MYIMSLLFVLGVLQLVDGDAEHTPLMVKTLPKHVNTPIALSYAEKPTNETNTLIIEC